mmetsp:Transcript_1837/g.1728  ORF Transcript_1837/g.1728 Transcript_1837/m.1728 type:complete len:137 (+) Transcript_1837:125-535(+)
MRNKDGWQAPFPKGVMEHIGLVDQDVTNEELEEEMNKKKKSTRKKSKALAFTEDVEPNIMDQLEEDLSKGNIFSFVHYVINGGDPNKKSSIGWGAIHYLADAREFDILIKEVLRLPGLDATLLTDDGENLLHFCLD